VAFAAVAAQVAQPPTVSDAAMDGIANVAAGMLIGVATERVNSTRNPRHTRIMLPPDRELIAVIAIDDAGSSSWISFPSDTHENLSHWEKLMRTAVSCHDMYQSGKGKTQVPSTRKMITL
jgi:hypothetical protein